MNAPIGKSKIVSITPELANHLAYYKAEIGFGVLAPRGWHCFGTYGSSGNNLYVSPEPIDASKVFSAKWGGLTGAAIQISVESGGTSGRFGVARIIARVFPTYKKFLTQVIAEDIRPASDFPSGPHPRDKLLYKGKSIVEFETPPNTDGLGTDSWLKKNATPISGVEILMEEEVDSMPDSLSLAVRLPTNLTGLTAAIIEQTELDSQRSTETGIVK